VKNAARGAFFRACEGAATLRAKASSVGATRVQARPRHRSTEKPEQHVPAGHFNDIGFDEVHSARYSDYINNGNSILFVIAGKNSNQEILDVYNEYGALDTDIVDNDLLDTY
jgi:hypothetical protein